MGYFDPSMMASRSNTSLPSYAEMSPITPPGLTAGPSHTPPPPVPAIPSAYAYPPPPQHSTSPSPPHLQTPYAYPYANQTSSSINLNLTSEGTREAPLHRPQPTYPPSPLNTSGREPSASRPGAAYGVSSPASSPDTDDGPPVNLAGRGTTRAAGYGPLPR